MPDRRKYAQRFLEMARETNDASVAVDALVWVVQHGARIPEGDEAVRMIADHHLQSDRIAAACHALGREAWQANACSNESSLRTRIQEFEDGYAWPWRLLEVSSFVK